ncbi:MAG: molybdopterin molybdenumtransferase MoeA, partial [Proteobacteria bacterium]|nr:molybdopterin molybdenumtransferase MoeA [Pseudomonadota bacterium]
TGEACKQSLLPFNNQSSGVGSSLSGADGLAIIPAYTSVAVGDSLEYIPFSELLS